MPIFTEESSPEMLQRAAGLKKPPLPRVSSPAPVNADRTADGAKHEVVVIGVCASSIRNREILDVYWADIIPHRLARPESCFL